MKGRFESNKRMQLLTEPHLKLFSKQLLELKNTATTLKKQLGDLRSQHVSFQIDALPSAL